MEVLKLKNRKQAILNLAEKIRKLMEGEETIRIMHLCGTHEDTITRYNLRSLMPENLELISGPGCPVCITPDTASGKTVAQAEHTFIPTQTGVMITTTG